MIRFLRRWDEHRPDAELRAGGTDLGPRRRAGLSTSEIDDLRDVAGLDRIDGGGIGARVTLAAIASSPVVGAGWPLLALAAAETATPQVRAVATIGGNLLQKVRCAWFRDPGMPCLLRGGDVCSARGGPHPTHGLEDTPCFAPHPSTMACALTAYDVSAEVSGVQRPLAAVVEGGVAAGEVLVRIGLPSPVAGERAAYRRASLRAHGDWPFVEVAVRRLDTEWRVVVGGVARVPRRLTGVEAALGTGSGPGPAAARAVEAFSPLPQTAWKVGVLVGLLQDAITALR